MPYLGISPKTRQEPGISQDSSPISISDTQDAPIDPPLVELPINTHDRGFYDGFSRAVTIPSKVIVSLLIMWAIFFPVSAGETLNAANSTIISSFSGWYVYLVAFLMLACFVVAVIPQSGRLKIGAPGDEAEFGRFSWFAMLFGAGIGIGMLTYSVGAVAGPIVGSTGMSLLGPEGLFVVIGGLATIGGLFGIIRTIAREAVPAADQQSFQSLPRTTPMAAVLEAEQSSTE